MFRTLQPVVSTLASASHSFNSFNNFGILADSPNGIIADRKGEVSLPPNALFFVKTSSLFFDLIWFAFLLLSSRFNSWFFRLVENFAPTRPAKIFKIWYHVEKRQFTCRTLVCFVYFTFTTMSPTFMRLILLLKKPRSMWSLFTSCHFTKYHKF